MTPAGGRPISPPAGPTALRHSLHGTVPGIIRHSTGSRSNRQVAGGLKYCPGVLDVQLGESVPERPAGWRVPRPERTREPIWRPAPVRVGCRRRSCWRFPIGLVWGEGAIQLELLPKLILRALTALAAPLVVLAILSAIVTNEIKGRLGRS